ncbi:hypothetical protein [uncultured Eubacterium sp.]|uniref:hypothetical protein n=1 Tax=uncultured Eubacterium sp. TaxID=165185 RepID=UPI0015B83C30|nr:hypothetical protein [uncultured Eubacterium sp.]
MRKIARILLVVALAGCSMFASYFVAQSAVKSDRSSAALATVTKAPVTEKNSDRILLVEDKKADYHFYKQGKNVVLVHKNVDYIFENWSPYIDIEKPELYMRQLDEDKPLELIIKAVECVNEDGSYSYCIYVINEIVREDGTIKYSVNALTRGSTKQVVDEKVKIEISQSPLCKKMGYVAFCYINDAVDYDRDTGVPKSYYNAFHIIQDENGNYPTLDGWERGVAEYTVEQDGVFVTFPITIKYKDTSLVQQVGYVKCMIGVDQYSNTYIAPKTMSFKPNIEYGAYRNGYDDKQWHSVWKNSNKATGGDSVIDFVQAQLDVSSELETTDFSKSKSDLNKLAGIVVTQDEVMLYAKEGYTFSKDLVAGKEFSVPLERQVDGDNSYNYDVAYEASISKSKKGTEILTIKLDQPYRRGDINKININFGVK